MTNSEITPEKTDPSVCKPGNEALAGTDPAGKKPEKPGGIRFLIMVFMIWNPAYEAWAFLYKLDFLENSLFTGLSEQTFRFYRQTGWSVVAVSSLISVLAGYGLWRKKQGSSVRRARWSLWLVGPLTVVIMRTLYFIMQMGGPAYFMQGFAFFVRGVFQAGWGYYLLGTLVVPLSISLGWAIGWTIYLGKSPKVREAYPDTRRNLTNAKPPGTTP